MTRRTEREACKAARKEERRPVWDDIVVGLKPEQACELLDLDQILGDIEIDILCAIDKNLVCTESHSLS
jgi:hypothetical protein